MKSVAFRRLSIVALLLFSGIAPIVLGTSVASASQVDCFSYGYACTPGYTGANANTSGSWAWKYYGGSWAQTANGEHNCTLYVAWRLQQNGMNDPHWSGYAYQWASKFGGNHTPAIGSVAWWGKEMGGGLGHVAYVEDVSGSQVYIRADNFPGSSKARGYTDAGWIPASSVDLFLHPHDVNSHIGHIVEWVNGGGKPNTSWIVRADAKRYWIPNTSTYWCMVNIGFSDLGPQSAAVLNSLSDTGQWASCPVKPRGAQDTLWPGQGLYQGQAITSRNGEYTLILQQDHNLVLYGPKGALWATNRWTGGYVVMQSDGNFVGYDKWGIPSWATNTAGAGGNCALVVQNDANLVLYCSGVAKWDRYHGRLY
jgi:surface antigen